MAWAQAEPAPEGYVPPGHSGPIEPSAPAEPGYSPPRPGAAPQPSGPLPLWHISIAPRLVVRLGDGPPQMATVGYGGGVQVARSLFNLGRTGLRFGLGANFAYDRVSRDKPKPALGTQSLSHATFAAVLIVDGIFGRVRPFLGVGGGLSVAAYDDSGTATAKATNDVAALGLVQLSLGVGVRVYESFELGLHGEFNFTFSNDTVGDPPKPIFQPGLFALGLDLGFRF